MQIPGHAANIPNTADIKLRPVYDFIWVFKTKSTGPQISQIIFNAMPTLQLIVLLQLTEIIVMNNPL